MLGEGKSFAVVDSDDFVDAVGELKAAIFDADPCISHRHDFAVQPDKFAHTAQSLKLYRRLRANPSKSKIRIAPAAVAKYPQRKLRGSYSKTIRTARAG